MRRDENGIERGAGHDTAQPAPVRARAATLPFDPLWYKDAVVYQVHVKSFFDSNDDGIGDFPGLTSKLDYIERLGVNALWLLPFYPSPRKDDGYDIADYRNVHPDYGTLDDVRHFIAQAHARGIRVISELVINHTSDQHAWFQAARRAPAGSALRDFYVWSDHDQRYAGTRVIFCDIEKSNWTWDALAQAYYWHRFYAHQPDLNFDNPRVLEEIFHVMEYWFELGIDGFRLDAVPYLVEREGTANENLPETHAVLKRLRAALDAKYPDRMLLAEANQWPEDTQEYFGAGDECHMAFHFPLMPRMYMAIAKEDRFPITDIMRQTPQIPDNCQWAIFLRNHDELTLEMVTDSERDYLWEVYASDRRARLNLGIRRRLAPLLERDRRRIELMNSLLLSMPGTPVMYYGDEIGMGDNIHLGDRDGVRTPMQWSPDRNGGFSRADPESLVLPAINNPMYGFATLNVEAQARDTHSLLNWMRRMLALRSQHRVFGRGTLEFLYPGNRKMLAYLRRLEAQTVLCVASLARAPQAVELDLRAFAGCVPVEMTGGAAFPPIGEVPYLLTLPPFGFYWFDLQPADRAPSWHAAAPEMLREYVTLVLRQGMADIAGDAIRTQLERDILPHWLGARPWFDAGTRPAHVRLVPVAALGAAADAPALFEVEVRGVDGAVQRYLLPLGIVWERDAEAPLLARQLALANVRRGARVGVLTDAFATPQFAQALLDLFARGATLGAADGALHFRRESSAPLDAARSAPLRWLSTQRSASSLVYDDCAVLKLLRRPSAGIDTAVQMGRQLARHGVEHVAPLLGEIALVRNDAELTVALLHGFVRNQGDAAQFTRAYLERLIDDAVVGEQADRTEDDRFRDYAALAGAIGRALGEVHAALALPSDDPAFAPQRATADEIAAVRAELHGAWTATAAITAHAADAVDECGAGADIAQLGAAALRTRIHGNLGLDKVLVAGGDACIVDFEGDPRATPAQRRALASPLRDVAALLRSWHDVTMQIARRDDTRLTPALRDRRERLLGDFLHAARRAFVAAYRATAPR